MNEHINDEITKAAKSLANWLYSDSHVTVNFEVLAKHLWSDFEETGRIPTEEECEVLATGGDEGDEHEELEEFFPNVSQFLTSLFE